MIHDLNPHEFDSLVLQSKTPVFVDFFTQTCSPCRALMPILNEITQEIGDSVQFMKLDATKDRDLAVKYQISSVPSFLLFHHGSVIARRIGQASKSELKEWIQKNIQMEE